MKNDNLFCILVLQKSFLYFTKADSEKEKGVTGTVIAKDGIAVIVNHDSPLVDLTAAQVKSIFTGEIMDWDEVIK